MRQTDLDVPPQEPLLCDLIHVPSDRFCEAEAGVPCDSGLILSWQHRRRQWMPGDLSLRPEIAYTVPDMTSAAGVCLIAEGERI